MQRELHPRVHRRNTLRDPLNPVVHSDHLQHVQDQKQDHQRHEALSKQPDDETAYRCRSHIHRGRTRQLLRLVRALLRRVVTAKSSQARSASRILSRSFKVHLSAVPGLHLQESEYRQ